MLILIAITFSSVTKIILVYMKLQKVMVPLLKTTRQPPDNADDFRQEYGFLGPAIHAALARARTQSITPTSSAPSLTSGMAFFFFFLQQNQTSLF